MLSHLTRVMIWAMIECCFTGDDLDTPINLQPQLAGRKIVFENRRILRYLRIAESSLTHQTTRIEVNRGVHFLR